MPARLFISYRRADSRLMTGRIYDRLVAAFGKRAIFMDIDNMIYGRDFRGVLREATANCRVMLVIIGPGWLNATDEHGNRRLDDPDDFVRLEVETGLQGDSIEVVPVLVDGATMPSAASLPPSLRELAFIHAATVRDGGDFHHDMDRLIRYLGAIIPPASNRLMRYIAAALALIILIAALIIVPPLLPRGDSPTPNPTDTRAVAAVNTTVAPTLESPPDVNGTIAAMQTLNRGATLTAVPTNTFTLTPTYAPTEDYPATVNAALTATEVYLINLTGTASEQLRRDQTATATLHPLNAPPEHVAAALVRAQNFTGTRNADWEPFVYTFPDDPAAAPMVLVPAGSFQMGSTEEANEQPIHTQTFATPFWIDQTEVTRAQWDACVRANACEAKSANQYSTRDTQPVNFVDWFEAHAYCAWRATVTGDDYRLPQEREWEYAARGVEGWLYPWGNNVPTDNLAVYYPGSGSLTADVGSKSPAGDSWVGAQDMSGNVWEWVNSLYLPYESVYNPDDGREASPEGNSTGVRGLRGGSFFNITVNLRGAVRFRYSPTYGDYVIGFRCVRS